MPVELLEPEVDGELLLGEVVEEPPIEPLLPEVLPEVPEELLPEEPVLPELPELLEPDLLKYASHSVREIWPLPSLSTDVKLGVDMLLPELDEPVPEAPLLELPLLPEAPLPSEPLLPEEPLEPEEPLDPLLPEDMLGLLLDEPFLPAELPDEVCAMTALESANSATAAVVVMTFNMENPPGGLR